MKMNRTCNQGVLDINGTKREHYSIFYQIMPIMWLTPIPLSILMSTKMQNMQVQDGQTLLRIVSGDDND